MSWQERADKINAYRVFPRIFVCSYLIFFGIAWVWIVWWFMTFDWSSIPQTGPVAPTVAAAVAGFPAIILGVLSKILKDLLLSYWNGKRPKYSQPGGDDGI